MKNINNTQKAKATKINGNCKGVRCTTDGSYYYAVKEAASKANVTFQAMSYAIRHKKPCKGKMYRFESETETNMMEMASNLGEYRAKAAMWDAYQAELKAEEERLEAIRKAKEKHDAEVAKKQDEVARLRASAERLNAKAKEADDKLMRAEIELEALLDKEVM